MKFHFFKARLLTKAMVVALLFNVASAAIALAGSASAIDRDSTAALTKLYKHTPGAKALADKAVAVLVFPSIVKGGFIIAGQYGDGALRKNGKSVGYGYALFFMDDASLRYLENSDGWEVGTGPSLVVLDSGFGKNFTTTTLQKGVYAFIFDQKGLMGGVGIQGAKITKINPNP